MHWVPLTTSKKMQKETICHKCVLIISKLIKIAVNDFEAKKSVRYSWAFFVTDLF